MKLYEFQDEVARVAVRKEVTAVLSESIIDFFGTTLAKLKNKHPQEVFSDQNPEKVSLDDVAKMITALKVITNKEYRTAITQDDVGINPNSAREIFKLLDDVKKTGQTDKRVMDVFTSLASLAPSLYRHEMKSLKDLQQDDDNVRKEAIKKLEAFMLRASQMFQKLKTGVGAA